MNKVGVVISKKEFCELTKTSENCWLFEKMTELPGGNFWKNNDGIVYYIDGNGSMRRFKDMPEYGEIWTSVIREKSDFPRWSIWSTWKQYD